MLWRGSRKRTPPRKERQKSRTKIHSWHGYSDDAKKMSFGFSVGHFIAVSCLVYKLSKNFYLVAKDASDNFQSLIKGLSLLVLSIPLSEDELKNPNSTLFRAGPVLEEMMTEMAQN